MSGLVCVACDCEVANTRRKIDIYIFYYYYDTGVEIDNLPMQIVDTQYPKTFFYEEDLHPEKTMNVQFSKSPFTQPFTVFAWLKGLEIKDIEKGHTFADICMMREHVEGERKFLCKILESINRFRHFKAGKEHSSTFKFPLWTSKSNTLWKECKILEAKQ